MQARDLAILQAVIRHRVLSTNQIEALFFGGDPAQVSSACRRRLRLLSTSGYLERHFQLQQPADGRLPHLFMPTFAGVELVAAELGEERGALDWKPSYNNVKWPFLSHQLALNDVYVAFQCKPAPDGWILGSWMDDRILKQAHTKTVRITEGKKTEKVGVVPDAYMTIELHRPPWQLHFFIERDRGTMPATATKPLGHSWHRRILAYNAAFDNGIFQEEHGTSSIRILTVTDSPARRASLKASTEAAGGRGRYWFATMENLERENPYTQAIWHRAGFEKPTELLQDGRGGG